MIEFNTADGEKLTIMHDSVAVKGYPGSDRSVLFIGGNFHALLHSYDEVVGTMEHFVYGPDQVSEPPAPTEEVIAEVVADDRAVGLHEALTGGVSQVRMEQVNAAQAAADAALKEAMAARNVDVHTDEGNVGHGAAAAAAEHVQEAPGAGTEHQSA